MQSSSSSSSSGSDDVFSDSVEEREINKREKIGKKKRYKKTRKYTVDESEATSSDSEEDRAKSSGRTWVKRLIELEDAGMDTIKATCRILVTLAGEMLEVFKSNGRANIKAVKPLKYGMERIQTFEAFLEDYERYALEQLGNDKNRWSVDLRNFLEGPALRLYYSIYRPKVNYTVIVSRLRKWCREEKEGEALDSQKEFWKIALNKDEKLTDFALRLQTTYETAVPKHQRDVEVLKKQFLDCIPKRLARRFRMRMGREKEAEKVKWKEMIKWAQEEDELDEEDTQERETQPQEPIPIWATVGRNMNTSLPSYGPRTFAHALRDSQAGQQQRPQQQGPQIGTIRCHHCHKKGHIKRECWRFLGWCLACGGNNHKVADCQNRRRLQRQERRQEPATEEKSMECMLCSSKGHGIQRCPEMERAIVLYKENQKLVSGNEGTSAPSGGCRDQQ